MKTGTKIIPNQDEPVLNVLEIQTVYESSFPRQALELEGINNKKRIISLKMRRKFKYFFLGLIILGLLIFCILFFYLKNIDTNNEVYRPSYIMNTTSPIPIPIPLSPTLSISSSISLSPTSILPIPSSPVLSISSSSSSSMASSSILSSSISSSLASSSILSSSPTLSPTNSPTRQYDYYVDNRRECISYTAYWCHHSCNHYPPHCPSCCIKI